ncbi:hypothetical protein F5888DRAFT_512542 [Russula emetica]|nr:hypothetical protein F5888DRAFT_512542 [Russula emetica]
MIVTAFLWVTVMMYCIRCAVSSLCHACLPCCPISGAFVDFASPLTPVANGREAGNRMIWLHRESASKSLMKLLIHLASFASLSTMQLIVPMKTMSLRRSNVLTSRGFPHLALLRCV